MPDTNIITVTLLTSVYRKPTNTEQYLHCDIHHGLSAKYCVFNTLTHSARIFCAHAQLLQEEEEHIRSALTRYKYPIWALDRLQINSNHRHSSTQTHSNRNNHITNTHDSNNNHNNTKMVVPYTKGLNKSFKHFCGKAKIQV